MKKNVACLIYGNFSHYLDHLSPLCYFLKIPLITNNEDIASCAKKYYPMIDTILVDNLNIHTFVVKNFDTIISCITKAHFDMSFIFSQDLFKKNIQIIWCPHGNSDKGKTISSFDSLLNEKFALVYGKKMILFLKEKKIFSTIKNVFIVGNYRLNFYKKFKAFYDELIKNEILKKIDKNKKNLLYAPTWSDYENSSSFEKYLEILLKTASEKYNLIIKLHPNIYQKLEVEIRILKGKYENKNILFLENFPLIYPLLNIIDIYLGDFSSIGYDFLYFQKPMYFLKPQNPKLTSDLFFCGNVIEDNNIFKVIEKNIFQDQLKDKIKKLYNLTFDSKVNLKKLKEKILNI